jgi:hypothetical protein
LQFPLEEGEFSAIMTNVGNGTEQWKTKVMSMLQGDGVNITDKPTASRSTSARTGRGSSSRSATRCARAASTRANRTPGPQSWDRSHLYLFKFTWAVASRAQRCSMAAPTAS